MTEKLKNTEVKSRYFYYIDFLYYKTSEKIMYVISFRI